MNKSGQSLTPNEKINHFSLKKTSKDFLEEMREKCGKRSQTTRRLIRKILHKPGKSRRNNLMGFESTPNLDFNNNDLTPNHKEDAKNVLRDSNIDTNILENIGERFDTEPILNEETTQTK